ncbi:MAG: vitamin K epoxide reductase family protein [Gemmatimonadota bacterium]
MPATDNSAGVRPVPLRMAIAVLALAGFFVALYLTLHALGITPLAACTTGGGCDQVQSSRFSSIAGVPVALVGAVGYVAILAVAWLGTTAQNVRAAWVPWVLLALTTIAFGFSAYLTALEAWVIHAWCPYCVSSAILATLIFLLSLGELRTLRGRSGDR